jgi:hypothetical protein
MSYQIWVSVVGHQRCCEFELKQTIVAINGNQLTFDAPIVQSIEAVYGGAIIYRYYKFKEEIQNVGIENMRLLLCFVSDTDENHGKSEVYFRRVKNSLMRQVTAKYFWYGATSIRYMSMYVTVEDCAMLQHKSQISSARRYSINVNDIEFVMFQCLLIKDGLHDFVAGSRTPDPIVFVDSWSINTYDDEGPHHRLSTEMIFDNI